MRKVTKTKQDCTLLCSWDVLTIGKFSEGSAMCRNPLSPHSYNNYLLPLNSTLLKAFKHMSHINQFFVKLALLGHWYVTDVNIKKNISKESLLQNNNFVYHIVLLIVLL